MNSKLVSAFLISCILSGCDSYAPAQYQTNPQNTIALQSIAASGKRASVANVSLAQGVEPRPTCRLAGPIDVGGGQDVASVVKQAMQAEFLAGNMYSQNGAPISAVITDLTPDSFGGKWTIGMTVSSPKGSLAVHNVSNFGTSFTAMVACKNTADAFNRALGNTIQEIVLNPKFRSLL